MSSRRAVLVVLGFAAALLAPLVARRVHPTAWTSVRRENRNPAPLPGWPGDLASTLAFPAAVEAWHADTFGLREPLLSLENLCALVLWNKAPHPRLLMGHAGWIFFTAEDSRDIWRGLYPIPPTLAEDWCSAVRSRASWFRSQGIAYLYVVAPNKESVYPDYLPASERSFGPTPLDVLARAAEADPALPLLDLRPALIAERVHDRAEAGDFVFHPHGTHWTERGGFAASQAIVARLSELYPELAGLAPAAREEYRSLPREGIEDTWAENLSVEDFYRQPLFDFRPARWRSELCDPAVETIDTHGTRHEQDAPELPVMLLVHDSFGPWMRRALAEHASRLVTLWQGELPPDRVASEAPRVVIEMYTERRLILTPEWLESGTQLLSREQFERLAPAGLEGGGADVLARIESFKETEFAREPDGTLRIRTRLYHDKLVLPAWTKPPRASLVLHLVLRAPERTSAGFWYQTTRAPSYHPRRCFRVALEPGLNDLYVLLPKDSLTGRMLFLPGESFGEYVLERLEARLEGG